MAGVPVGPHFDYDAAPGLFLGRHGTGPLNVVWDTNVLVDYLIYGGDFWENRKPQIADEEYYSQLEALQIVMSIWQLRDIRFHVLPLSVGDARTQLSTDRRLGRLRALDRFVAALTIAGYYDEDEAMSHASSGEGRPPLAVTPAGLESILMDVPEGVDRELVRQSVQMNAHVFLTRDKGILRCRDQLRPLGLFLASPLDLLEELAACGAILCKMSPEYLYWPLPDLQATAHLIEALGED